MKKNIIIFTDIDDTVMKTTRKIDNITKTSIGAYGENGQILSCMESFHNDFVNTFFTQCLTIPVTARSLSGLNRVNINFEHEKIINFGAHVIDKDGLINRTWHNNIISQQNTLNIIEIIQCIKKSFIYPSYMQLREREQFNTFIFLNFRNEHINLQENIIFGQLLEEFLIQHNIDQFYLHITDRDVTIIPHYIKKQFAVQFLLEQYANMTSIGIGDHKNDFSFMKLCHFSIFPNDSSIANILKVLT